MRQDPVETYQNKKLNKVFLTEMEYLSDTYLRQAYCVNKLSNIQ